MLQNVPEYMKTRANWVAWRLEDRGGAKPTKVPISPHTGRLASVTRPDTWNSLENAENFWKTNPHHASGVGYVLTAECRLVFVDFDLYDGNGQPFPQEIYDLQWQIAKGLDSYMEQSPGGGLHVICKGALPSGRRWSEYGIEMYSSGRYMTMTGNVIHGHHNQLRDRQTAVTDLWEQIATRRKNKNVISEYAGYDPEVHSDARVWEIASKASNGDAFVALWNGDLSAYMGDQSRADFALIDMLAFYSPNRDQVYRMFLQSALGQRDKAFRSDYAKSMLDRAYDNKLPEYDFDTIFEEVAAVRVEASVPTIIQQDPTPEPIYKPDPQPAPREVKEVNSFESSTVKMPPGLLGEIAQFIYNQAPRQIPEAAVCGAISFLSAFAGRYWSVEGDGLNNYLLLLAGTGTGKEAMYSGINKLFDHLITTRGFIQVEDYRGPGDFSSGQAILQHFADHTTNCFLSMMGEFGFKLMQLSNNDFGPNVTFKKVLLDLYTKCKPSGVVNQSVYSDKSRNTEDIKTPSFTLVGDSQHETFYEGIDESTLNSGLLPRFVCFHYQGKRNPTNRHHAMATISPSLDSQLTNFVGTVLGKLQLGVMETVLSTPAAEAYRSEIDVYCDAQVNEAPRTYKPLWTRAYMKTLKLAGLCAVGRNPVKPVIDVIDLEWAQSIVFKDIECLTHEISRGSANFEAIDIAQQRVIKDIIVRYIRTPYEQLNTSGAANITMAMYDHAAIPLAYITRYAGRRSAFKKDRMRPAQLVRRTLQDMVDNGDLRELTKPEASRKFKFSGVCFMVENRKILDEAKHTRFD